MYQFRFCYRKGDAQAGRLSFKLVEQILEPADITTVGDGSHCEGEVVHVRYHQAPRDPEVQWRNVENEEERGDWRALAYPLAVFLFFSFFFFLFVLMRYLFLGTRSLMQR